MYCLCVRCNVTSRHHLYWPVILYSVSRDHYPCTSSVTRFYFSEATSDRGSRVLSAYWLVRGTTQQLYINYSLILDSQTGHQFQDISTMPQRDHVRGLYMVVAKGMATIFTHLMSAWKNV